MGGQKWPSASVMPTLTYPEVGQTRPQDQGM